MPSWWDVPGAVRRFNSWTRLIVIGLAFGTATAGGLVWFSVNPVAEKRTEREALDPEVGQQPKAADGQESVETATRQSAQKQDEAERALGAKIEEVRRPPVPRTLSSEQTETVGAMLRGFPLDQHPLAEPIMVLATAGNAEAAGYAAQIAAAIRGAGWAANTASTIRSQTGVHIIVANGEKYPVHAEALKFTLERAGIDVVAFNLGRDPSNLIQIVVGQNPGEFLTDTK
jgi:hypothetical protein